MHAGAAPASCGCLKQAPCEGNDCSCGLVAVENVCVEDGIGCIDVPAVSTAPASNKNLVRSQSASGVSHTAY
jgi:hypothetical protein